MNKEKLLLLTLAAVQFTHIMDFMIMMPLGPQLMRLFQIDPGQFSYIVSSYTFSAGIAGFLASFVIDKFDRKKAILFVYGGFTIGTFFCGMASSYHLLLIARMLTGAFGGVSGALVLSIVGDAIPNERRASAMGVVMAAFSVASVFGVPFGLFLATHYSWNTPFIFIAAVGLLINILIVKYIPSITAHLTGSKKLSFEFLGDLFKSRDQLLALLLMIMLMLGQFTVIPFISPYMVANVGFTEKQLTWIYLIGGGVTIFSSPLIGKWADKVGRLKVFTVFIFVSLIPLFGITNLPRVAVPVALCVTTLFFITSGGRTIPAMAMITSSVPGRIRGSFMTINSSVQQLAAGVAALVSGLIVTKDSAGHLHHYSIVGYIAITASLLCLLIAPRLKPAEGVAPAGPAAAEVE
jgi:MFS transporter, DHA1 family, inner membrane transport protein